MKHKYFLKLSLILALTIGINLNGFSQDIHFTFQNAQNTNEGADDYFEVDVMIQTINATGTFKLGGQCIPCHERRRNLPDQCEKYIPG